jgi:HEAT repeat protein
MTPRFRLALVVLVALGVVTLSIWMLKGGAGGGGDSTSGGRADPENASGRPLAGTNDPNATGGAGATGGRPSGTGPGGVTLRPGIRAPEGLDLTDPAQRRKYLLQLLAKGPESWDDVAALVALTTEPLDPAVKEALLKALMSGDRNGVSKALNVANDPSLVPDLLAVVDDPNAPAAARRVALLALGQMPGGNPDEVAKALEARLQGNANADFEVLDAIARRGGRESVRAVVEYVERSKDAARLSQALVGRMDLKTDPELASIVADALGRQQSPGALETLVAIAGQPGVPALAAALVALDRDDVPEALRTKVLDALSQNGTVVAIDHLIAVSRQPGMWGEKAILALEHIPKEASREAKESLVRELERAALNPRPDLARSALLTAAGRLGVKEALPAMVESFRSSDDNVRNKAISAVGLLGHHARPHVAEVAKMFAAGTPATRTSVAVALGNIGGPEALAALEEFLKEPSLDSSLRRTIGYAIEQLQGGAGDGTEGGTEPGR